jgi:hypothetical protein
LESRRQFQVTVILPTNKHHHSYHLDICLDATYNWCGGRGGKYFIVTRILILLSSCRIEVRCLMGSFYCILHRVPPWGDKSRQKTQRSNYNSAVTDKHHCRNTVARGFLRRPLSRISWLRDGSIQNHFSLKMEKTYSSETSVLTRDTRHHIPEDILLLSCPQPVLYRMFCPGT